VIAIPAGRDAEFSRVAPGAILVTGGDTRSASVGAALERVETNLVAVHDAARPLVTAELTDRLVARLAAHPDATGVIAATPLADTVKRATGADPDQLAVARTESRQHLWAAQTPQVFRTDALRAAHAADLARTATDDSALVEAAGGTVLLEESPAGNMKVTTPADLEVAAALLEARP
jgi:2-C-methyl-D-erythritol 4-phosphate cytidylyltransferase